MAKLTITKGLQDLQTIFNKVNKAFFTKTVNANLATLASFDLELPILEDVETDLGEKKVNTVKLSDGTVWVTYASKEDGSISLQIPSIADDINELFMDKAGEEVTMANGFTDNGETYKGQGYADSLKKAVGGLFLRSEDKNTAIFFPNVEMYGSLKTPNDKPAYFNVKVTPKTGSEGATFYILKKQ